MSDDIDRLKTVLEQLQRVNDTLQDDHDVMRDVVNSTKPVELETDPEGHAALRDHAREIKTAFNRLQQLVADIGALQWKLETKARLS